MKDSALNAILIRTTCYFVLGDRFSEFLDQF